MENPKQEMKITLRSGKDLIGKPAMKKQELYVQLVSQQAKEKQVAAKYAKNSRKSEYLKVKVDECT